MAENESREQDIDWRLTTFEGVRREQLRRWAELPLERIVAALEERQALGEALATASESKTASKPDSGGRRSLHEPKSEYGSRTERASSSGDGKPTGR